MNLIHLSPQPYVVICSDFSSCLKIDTCPSNRCGDAAVRKPSVLGSMIFDERFVSRIPQPLEKISTAELVRQAEPVELQNGLDVSVFFVLCLLQNWWNQDITWIVGWLL